MEHLREKIRSVENFPKRGVTFRDITPILQEFSLFQDVILEMGRMADNIEGEKADKVVGIESRGFILAPAVALSILAGFVPVRKCVGTESKLPRKVFSCASRNEYGTELLDIHQDAILPGERIVIVDDVLATGGTAASAAKLVQMCGGIVVKIIALIEIKELGARENWLKGYDVESLIEF